MQMQRVCILTVVGVVLFFGDCLLDAANDVKERRSATLFQGAQRCFRSGQWATAASWFQEFIENNPSSPQRNEATLYRAQALFQLKQYRECFNELRNAEETSGLFAAQFKFWMAECRYREAEDAPENQGLYRVAAQLYAEVPKSDCLVAANVSEAMAHAQLEDWPRVVELLQPTASPFQQFAASSAENSLAVQGRLILAEALLRQNLYTDAARMLDQLSVLELADHDRWRRQMLFSSVLISQKNHKEALNILQELLHTSENRMPQLRAAQAIELKLHVHKELGQFAEAAEMCRNLWQDVMPMAVRRRGLLLALGLAVRSGAPLNIAEFHLQSETVLEGESLAVAQVALGDLHLIRFQQSQKLTGFVTRSSHLEKSGSQYRAAIGSIFSGYARAGLAWNSWQMQRYGESCTNFIQAAVELTDAAERSRSQFKAIESAFRSRDMHATLSIGRNFLTNSSPLMMKDSAKFLMLRAAIRTTATGTRSLEEARRYFSMLAKERNPRDFWRASLFLARAESKNNNPAIGRELLKQLSADTRIKRVVELESARTFVNERDWPSAISRYEDWIKKYIDAPANQRAQVFFDCGWLHYLNNSPAKTKRIYMSIVKQFPDSLEASRAQMWMADYLFNQNDDEDYVKAEESYQKVRDMRNSPAELKYRASLMAGRAALARRSFRSASEYFRSIANDKACPEAIKIEAKFALSDTAILNNAEFEEAITILESILNSNGKMSSLIDLQTHGRIGDCHLQMAAEDPNRYLKAQEAYRRVLELSSQMSGDPPVRYRAMMGMAQSLKNMPEEDVSKRNKNLIQALGWAKKVFEGATSAETELEPFWIRQSGLMSADIQMRAGKPMEEIATLKALGLHFGKMRPLLDARINQIRQQLREARPEKSTAK
jgi:tetratricopeptide (TPR) repeat protein